MVFGLVALGQVLLNLAQGFAFGTGYGSGVRFGYEDVYPWFKGQAQQVMEWLGLTGASKNTFSQSGFKMSSGLNDGTGFSSPAN